MIWCIILGVPSQLFGLYPGNTSFAYGAYRQNYVYSGEGYAIMDPNMQGGNFYGGGDTTVLNLNEVVYALQLRYASLVSNGRISFINRMLNFIFNGGKPWDCKLFLWSRFNTSGPASDEYDDLRGRRVRAIDGLHHFIDGHGNIHDAAHRWHGAYMDGKLELGDAYNASNVRDGRRNND
jgi:hypothetical protein